MKQGKHRSVLKFGVCAVVAMLAGCQRETSDRTTTTPSAPVQGALIIPNTNSPITLASSATNGLSRTNSTSAAAPTRLAMASGSEKPGEPLVVGFDRLASYTYDLPDDLGQTNAVPAPGKIPKEIRALDNRLVALKGFMLPLKVEGGLVTEMLIMRDQSMCCYGAVPKINEWVSVKMTKTGVKPIMDQPVTLFGKLRVGEMRENGYLVGIYALEGESMNANF